MIRFFPRVFSARNIPKEPVKFALYVSRKYTVWILSAFAGVIVATISAQYGLVVIGDLTDVLTEGNFDYQRALYLGGLYALLWFVSQCCWRWAGLSGRVWFVGMRANAYQSLYNYLTLHNKEYFNSRFAGSLANKISNAANGTETLLSRFMWKFFPLIFGLILYVIIAWEGNAWFGIVITVWSTIFIIINLFLSRKLRPLAVTTAKTFSELKGTIIDSLSNISTVHEYAHQNSEKKYVAEYIGKQSEASKEQWLASEKLLFINGVMIFIFVLIMTVLSLHLFNQDLITLGVVILIFAIVRSITGQLFFLGQEINGAMQTYGQAQEGLEDVLTKHMIVDDDDAQSVRITKGALNIHNVGFKYDDTEVFTDFNLEVKPGEKVGIVGRSGTGKTTLVSLILRHFDVQEGSISIDGYDIRDITLESLRKAIAFVPQDTSLFHRTIRENIRYSKQNATTKEIEKAAKQALAYDFIKNLPKSYDTLVGERGVKLSGGQRQRIAIARAFLKNSPILILDEATSSLDSESEEAIQKSLDSLMKNRTVIAIAHRLSTLKKMDRIVIIDDGKIVEDGTPDELIKKKDGIFKNMWDHQVSGFILDED